MCFPAYSSFRAAGEESLYAGYLREMAVNTGVRKADSRQLSYCLTVPLFPAAPGSLK